MSHHHPTKKLLTAMSPFVTAGISVPISANTSPKAGIALTMMMMTTMTATAMTIAG